MKTTRIQLENEIICIQDSGGSKQQVIFIGANCTSRLSFSKQLEDLPTAKYRLIAIKLPGHGDSSPAVDPVKTYSMPGYVSIIVRIISELDLKNVVLAGHCLGGHIVLEASPKLTDLKRVLVFGTPPMGIPPKMDKAFLPGPAFGLLVKNELSPEECRLLASTYVEQEENRSIMTDQLLATDPRTREYLEKSLSRLEMEDEIKIVSKMPYPLAVFHTAREPIVNFEYVSSIPMPTLWRGSVQVIPDTGHFPQLEAKEAFNKLLLDFLGDI